MRQFSLILVVTLLVACGGEPRDYSEISIAELHDRMQRGEVTAEALARWYLERIESLDHDGPTLNSIIEINPDALDIAKSLDDEWRRIVSASKNLFLENWVHLSSENRPDHSIPSLGPGLGKLRHHFLHGGAGPQ